MRKLLMMALVLLSIKLSMGQLVLGISAQTNLAYEKPLGNNVESSGMGINVGYGIIIDNYFTDNYAFSMGVEIINSQEYIEPMTANVTFQGQEYSYLNVQIGNVQYMALPLCLKLKSVQIGYASIFANFGLLPAYTLSQRSAIIADNTFPEADFFKKMILSYRIGGGYSYSLGGTTSLNLGLYYDASLTDMTKIEGDNGLLFRSIALKGSIMF